MKKLLAIAWKGIYTTFTDRTLIIIMIVIPLAVSVIVGLAFGGLGSGDVPVRDIPVAIINQDTGGSFGVNYGQIFVRALVPSAEGVNDPETTEPVCELAAAEATQGNEDESQNGNANFSVTLDELTNAVVFDAAAAQALAEQEDFSNLGLAPTDDGYLEALARAAVDRGIYTVLLVIPPDFSQKIAYAPVVHPQIEQTGVSLYANSGQPISAGIIRSVIESITQQIASGNIAIASTFGAIQNQFGLTTIGQVATDLDMGTAFACAFTPALNIVKLDRQFIAGQQTNSTLAILVSVGAGQAMFFALFTATFGVLDMYEERRNGTLQRLFVSPTSRSLILSGKLIGTTMTVLFQVVALMIALTLIGSLLQGAPVMIWGQNIIALVLVVLSVAVSVSGLGMLMAGIARTPEQGQAFGQVINIAMAILGGAFGFQLPQAVAQFSLIYWGREAFEILARGQTDIGLHVVVLLVQGTIMFAIGLLLFNRRFEV